MIPAWQHSLSPGVNIKLNDHVEFPPGWTQRTVQPVGPYYAAARIAQPELHGFGLLPRTKTLLCDQSCGCAPQNPCCCPSMFQRLRSMNGFGLPIARQLGIFDSWAYQNRKWLVIGGLGLIAAAGVGITASILR